jgi:hypothetical protein
MFRRVSTTSNKRKNNGCRMLLLNSINHFHYFILKTVEILTLKCNETARKPKKKEFGLCFVKQTFEIIFKHLLFWGYYLFIKWVFDRNQFMKKENGRKCWRKTHAQQKKDIIISFTGWRLVLEQIYINMNIIIIHIKIYLIENK